MMRDDIPNGQDFGWNPYPLRTATIRFGLMHMEKRYPKNSK